ncbi:BpmI endonuclease-methyltransferase fusion protein type IIG, partial [hydrothermal vent metagenome]
MPLFQKSVLNTHLNNLDEQQVADAYDKFQSIYNPNKIAEIKTLKEEVYQDGFLRDIFVEVFGYVLQPEENYNLQREFKNQSDNKKADGAILKDGHALAVIELKSTKTKDLTKVTQQAFNYKNNQPECKYVITSNFQKLRFYIDYAHEYEEFDLFNLQKDEFTLLYMLLHKDNLLSNLALKIKKETKFHEKEISDKLYKDYSSFKRKLFANLVKNHPDIDQLELFKKSQKLLDRFLFILFSEDSGLLPPNLITTIITKYRKLEELDYYQPLYDIFKQYFGYINNGDAKEKISEYNGGLFKADQLLDNLIIDDMVLIDDLMRLSIYDFNTEVDVNILGHIFEHSLSEIEEITAQIEGKVADKKKSKRKKDGVFYTPKYITQYIVDNTVGTLCNEKRIELGIEEIEFDGTYRKQGGGLRKAGEKLYQTLNEYKDWLLTLKILDPACGSGAFLNQALNFLIAEHKNIDDILEELTGHILPIFDTDKSILENNLFGVDINEESVEIAQLSLWLRTAKKGRKLSSLNNNIKCGNSLIDDPEVAGDKAFDWHIEFKDIMENGGFDVVIGNPPYVRQELIKPFKGYLSENYHTYQSSADLYVYFIELCIDKLISKNGIYSIIVANKWMRANYGKSIRCWLKEKAIVEIIDFGDLPVFEEATAYPCILTVKAGLASKKFKGLKIDSLNFSSLEYFANAHSIDVNQDLLEDSGWSLIDEEISKLLVKLKGQGTSLKIFIDNKMYIGLKTGLNAAFIIDAIQYEEFIRQDSKYLEIIKPYAVGRDITRYGKPKTSKYIICIPRKWTNSKGNFNSEKSAWSWFQSNYTLLAEYLNNFMEQAIKRSDKGDYWWELRACEYYGEFEKPKIIYSEIATEGRFTIDSNNLYCDMTAFVIGSDSTFLLAILNSKLFTFLFKHSSSEIRGGFLRWKRQYLYPLPIPENTNNIFENLVNEITQKYE